MRVTIAFELRHPRQAGVARKLLGLEQGRELIVGRQEGVDLRLQVDDRRISRKHFSIALEGSQLLLRNLSRNGTVVNGRKILDQRAPVSVGAGDTISLGELRIDLDVQMALEDAGDPLIGMTLQGFTIEAGLPEGPLGRRYRAVQQAMGRAVEIQLVDDVVLARREELVERFFRTAKLAGVLVHPNVIQIYDCGELKELGAYFMALEYVGGATLADLLQQRRREDKGPLPRAEALRIARQIGSALQHGHDRRIVHRNVTPETILIDQDGEAKLAGLGLAKTMDEEMSSLTQAGGLLGALRYAAPEQILDASAVDSRADVYSLGAVLFEMLTGQPPLDARTPKDILDQLLGGGGAPRADALDPDIPTGLADALDRALTVDPEERIDTIDGFLDLLAGVDRKPTIDPRTLARTQRNFLAMLPDPPAIPGFEFAAYFAPCEVVGGDFYDVFPVDGGRIGITVGDVSGHGLDAAIVVGMAKTASRIYGQHESSPARALAAVNQLVRPQLAEGSFFSCCLAVLDPGMLQFTFARGGHNPVLLHNPARSTKTQLLEPRGCALGMLPERVFHQEEHAAQLQRGDVLVMFTDGVTEAVGPDGDFYELGRLIELLDAHPIDGTAAELLELVAAELNAFAAGTPFDDDVTLVALKVTADPPEAALAADATMGHQRLRRKTTQQF